MDAVAEEQTAQEELGRPWHYDGRNANRWRPDMRVQGNSFLLVGDDWQAGPYAFADLIAFEPIGGRSVYGLKGESGWRLGFDGPPPPAVAAHLPAPVRYGRWVDRIGLLRASILFGALAACTLLVVLSAPRWIAPFIPRSWENRMGDAMVGDFGGRFCASPAGDAALRTLAARMDGAKEARDIKVAHIPLINAITLPGGRIIIFDGLLKDARSPDELAGILGHELGHVHNRDTLTALLRQLGLSVLLGGASGDVGGYLNGVLMMSYGREAETQADSHSIALMRSASVDPAPTAGFFTRLGRLSDKKADPGRAAQAMNWLSTHPLSAERRNHFQQARDKVASYRPALGATEWKALRGICANAKSTDDFWDL